MTEEEDPWGGNPSPFSLVNGLSLVAMFGGVVLILIAGVIPWTREVERVAAEERERMLLERGAQPGSEPFWRVALDGEAAGSDRVRNRRDGALLIRVPAGAFPMGRADGPARCRPARTVKVSSYWIDRDPVTRARYARFLAWADGAGPRHAHRHPGQPESKTSHQPVGWDRDAADDRPVTGVDWFDAYSYASWAGLRLPTEAEWARAARGTDGRRYPWGTEALTPKRAQFGDLSPGAQPVSVEQLVAGAGPLGARHQLGTVWEWCYDRFDATFYGQGSDVDPRGPVRGKRRVVRGGSYRSAAAELHLADRRGRDVLVRQADVGFRCAR